jgi:AcrR family transcriptional regulator
MTNSEGDGISSAFEQVGGASRWRIARGRVADRVAGPLRTATTEGVTEEAGVQVPAIYQLFDDKAGLLEAVPERVIATCVHVNAAIVEAASPVRAASAVWRIRRESCTCLRRARAGPASSPLESSS